MSNSKNDSPDVKGAPEPEFREKKRHISIVWLVPLVALAIGGWLVYKAISEKGPTVAISFKSAEGLEAGKTKIKYKEVELGLVTSIELDDGLSEVIVMAEMVKKAEKFVSENSRFWVVRARVAAGSISGLGTLFSGAYIGLDPGKPGKPVDHFKGLEIPPVVTAELPGNHYVLRAPSLGSLQIGDPVYFRRIEVGQVVSYKLDEDGQAVTIEVFVHDPHHNLVRQNTRFWNASGLDFAIDANGIRVNTESMVTIMVGGIAFTTPDNLEPGGPADDGETFKLYESRERIFDKTYTEKTRWILHFQGSVRGLTVGSPVEFRGIRVGQVLDINMEYNAEKGEFLIPVLIVGFAGVARAECTGGPQFASFGGVSGPVSYVYTSGFSGSGGYTVNKAPKTGGESTVIGSGDGAYVDIAVDETCAYVADLYGNEIRSFPTSG